MHLHARSAKNLPPKPEALVLYEQIKELGIPLVEGGIVDQPHIWMEQYAVCATRTKLWDIIDKNAQQQLQSPQGTANGQLPQSQ